MTEARADVPGVRRAFCLWLWGRVGELIRGWERRKDIRKRVSSSASLGLVCTADGATNQG